MPNLITIPCKYCGTDTPSLGTRLCDRCWEMERNIDCTSPLFAKMVSAQGYTLTLRRPLMHIDNFEHPINFYQDNMTLEDWFANFTIEVEERSVEIPPPHTSNPLTTVAVATFTDTKLGELTITRDMLIFLFTEKAVAEQELAASIAYLEHWDETNYRN